MITTVPLADWVTEPIDFGPASTSVSFVSTSIAVASASSATVALSLTATGLSSPQVTVTLTIKLQTKYNAYDSGASWAITGDIATSGSTSFNHGSGTAWSSANITTLATRSKVVPTSFSNSVVTNGSASVTGLAAIAGTATVNWTAPTTNTDGSSLTNLAGFRIAYGTSQTNLDRSVDLDNASLSTYTVNNLSSGTWYFAVYAVNASGVESDISNIGSKAIP